MRCNRCHRPMTGTTGYDGACACGGLIETGFRFPVVTSHELVSCYNCGGDLVGDWWNDTGERHLGMGRYRQACEKCREVTHYDLVKEIEAERGRLDPDLPMK